MENNIATLYNQSKIPPQTPVWDLTAEKYEAAYKINQFVYSFGLSFISTLNGISFSLTTIGKLSIVIFTWEFKELAKTAGKALFCFFEVIYIPFIFPFSSEKVIGWHEKIFGVGYTLRNRELFREEMIKKCETLELKLNKETGEKKLALEKMDIEINQLNENIKKLEEEQTTSSKNTIPEINNELKKENNQMKSLLELNKTELSTMEKKYTLYKESYQTTKKELETVKNQLEDLQKLNEEKKPSDIESIFNDSEYNNINKKETDYSNLMNEIRLKKENGDEKTTDDMFNSYFQTKNNNDEFINENFMHSIIINDDDDDNDNIDNSKDQVKIKGDQKKALLLAIETKKTNEKGISSFELTSQKEISDDIDTSLDQLTHHEGDATFTTNPVLNKKEESTVYYQPKQISKNKIKISILENSTPFEELDLFYQGCKLECGGNSKEKEGRNNNALDFAESLEFIIMDIIEKDKAINKETKNKLKENFDTIVNTVYHHISSGSGTNIKKLSDRLFNKHMNENNPLRLSLEQSTQPLRTDLSIDKDGNFCIEQRSYFQLMLPNLGEKISTRLFSKSTAVTKISIDDPNRVVMTGNYTNYIPQKTHEEEENQKIKSQEGYWSKFKASIIDTKAKYKDEKYELSLQVIENGFKEDFKKGIGLNLELFRKELNLNEKTPINLETLQKAYKNKKDPDPLNESVRDILNLLNNEEDLEIRKKYQGFITLLRKALETETYKSQLKRKMEGKTYDPTVDLLLNMSYYRLAENNLYEYCQKTVTYHLIKGCNSNATKEEEGSINLHDHDLKKQCEAIDNIPANMKGTIGVGFGKFTSTVFDFDPHRKTNVPFTWGTIKLGDKLRKWLRMASPTNQTTISTYNNPEFIAFLYVLKIKGEKFVYINLQDDSNNWINTEKSRINKTRELTKSHSDVFEMFSLPYDSDLYYQTGIYAKDEEPSKRFKEWIIEAIKKNDQGYYFPEKFLTDDTFMKNISEIVDDVHLLVFNNAEKLDIQKRKDFMSILNAFLAQFLFINQNADFMLAACKENKDRGGQLNGLILQFIGALQGKLKEEKYREIIRTFYNGPSIIASKEAIIEKSGRRSRAISAYNEIESITFAKNVSDNPERCKKYGVTEESVLMV